MSAATGWLRRGAWAGCAFLAWTCLALDPERSCSRTQYEAHGKCCSRCPAGQRVSVPCNESSDTVCSPCESHRFQDGWTKQTVCTPHRYCDPNAGLVVHIEGSAVRNVVCWCRNGSHCSGDECQSCRENTACGPGEGAEQIATNMRDTVCAECRLGFFSNFSSATAPCQLWSSCEALGLVQKADGTRSSDVVCEEAPKVRSGTLVLVALAPVMVGLVGLGLLLWHRRRRPPHEPPKEAHPEEEAEGPPGCERLEPSEVDDDESSLALPIPETWPTTYKDGKAGGLAELECA